jgi:hypothetical protein
MSKCERQAVTVWQPSTRLVLLVAWLDDDEARHEAYPVLGLQARTDDDGDPYHEPLALLDGQVVTARDARRLFFSDDAVTRLVAADWPAEEDEKRLALDVGQLVRTLLRRKEVRS